MFKKILEFFKILNPQMSDEAKKEFDKLVLEAEKEKPEKPEIPEGQDKKDPPKIEIPKDMENIEVFRKLAENLNSTLEAEIAKRQKLEERIEGMYKNDLNSKIDAEIASAVKMGRIPAQNTAEIAEWKARFEKDFADAKKIIEKIPAKINNDKNSQTASNDAGDAGLKITPREQYREAAIKQFKIDMEK